MNSNSPHHSANPYHLPPRQNKGVNNNHNNQQQQMNNNNLYNLDTLNGWSPQQNQSASSTNSNNNNNWAASGSSTRGSLSLSGKIPKVEFDDELDDDSDGNNGNGNGNGGAEENVPEVKKKSTRGSRACTVCRKVRLDYL